MRVLLSIGSNLGGRLENITSALEKLNKLKDVEVKQTSHIYETEPVGRLNQPVFYNIAVEIETDLSPLELLSEVKKIEYELGRIPQERWGPRVIDIDIIFYGNVCINEKDLILPHAEFRRRRFVLEPLAEICSEAVDPVTGKTVKELLSNPEVEGKVVKTELKVTP